MNSDAKDMDEVLIKGSASDVVKNQDLDEFKSPAGSKTRLEKSNDGKIKLYGLHLHQGMTSKE